MTNDYREEIESMLNSIKHAGSYVHGGPVKFVCNPGLDVNSIGPIGLPLSKQQAEAIITQCSLTPFGWKADTILDTTVWNTWQLDPSQFSLNNAEWQDCIDMLIKEASIQLGLMERGGHGWDHVVMLPSDYEGGQLIVKHDGNESVFDFRGKKGQYTTNFVAFYADCLHEIHPVTKAIDIFTCWGFDTAGPAKIAYILKHKYTEAGVSFDNLKNHDRVAIQLLQQAANVTSIDILLAKISCYESGGTEDYGCDPYKLSSFLNFISEEDTEVEYKLTHWVAADEKKIMFGELTVDNPEELIPENALEGGKPDDEEIKVMGNEGTTLEQWYHAMMVVLWPSKNMYRVKCEGKVEDCIKALEKEMDVEAMHAFAQAIVES
ncbi:hypothetical protein BC936DRAFT_140296, partial [Jimgerdemannia flammicorona]